MDRRKKGSRAKKARAAVAACALAVIGLGLFTVYGIGLYREKKLAQAQAQEWMASQETVEETLVEEEYDGQIHDRIEYNGKTYRRNTYIKAVLCMGIDRKGTLEETTVSTKGGQSDGIFLIAHDTAHDSVRILVIPRDTMTPITLTDLRGNVLGQGEQHLTLAYAYGDGREKSCEYMKEAVSNLLCGLEIDRYAAISVSGFNVINDTIGGVTVTITDDSLALVEPEFTKGAQVLLTGELAERYVRYRDITIDNSALDRGERQKTYIAAFVKALKERARKEEGLATRLLEEIQPYMVTDMPKGEYLDMALAIFSSSQNLTTEDMITLPGTPVVTSMFDEYHVDEAEILPVILDLFYREETA